MESKIYIKEKVQNKDAYRSAAKHYYPVLIVYPSGIVSKALFTMSDITKAEIRGDKNKEDFPAETKPTWKQKITNLFKR